jgi:ribonuclease P protein component
MLPRRWHLVQEKDFSKVYRQGKRWRGEGFLIWRLTTTPQDISRCAVVVSGKVSTKATERNLIRRRVWAVLREYKNQLPPQGVSIVISAQTAAKRFAYQGIKQEISRGLGALGLSGTVLKKS